MHSTTRYLDIIYHVGNSCSAYTSRNLHSRIEPISHSWNATSAEYKSKNGHDFGRIILSKYSNIYRIDPRRWLDRRQWSERRKQAISLCVFVNLYITLPANSFFFSNGKNTQSCWVHLTSMGENVKSEQMYWDNMMLGYPFILRVLRPLASIAYRMRCTLTSIDVEQYWIDSLVAHA